MDLIGEKIKQTRTTKGLSQKSLAKLCDLNEGTIRDYENGKINPSVKALYLLSNILNVPISYLLGEEKNEGKENQDLQDLRKLLEPFGFLVLPCDNKTESFESLTLKGTKIAASEGDYFITAPAFHWRLTHYKENRTYIGDIKSVKVFKEELLIYLKGMMSNFVFGRESNLLTNLHYAKEKFPNKGLEFEKIINDYADILKDEKNILSQTKPQKKTNAT